MMRGLLVAVAAGLISLPQSGAACIIYQELRFADARLADVVFIGRVADHLDVAHGSAMRLKVSEVLHGTPPAEVNIGWTTIMGPPHQHWEVGTLLVIAADAREPVTRSVVSGEQIPIDYWVQQAACTDAFVLVADAASLASIRAELDPPK